MATNTEKVVKLSESKTEVPRDVWNFKSEKQVNRKEGY